MLLSKGKRLKHIYIYIHANTHDAVDPLPPELRNNFDLNPDQKPTWQPQALPRSLESTTHVCCLRDLLSLHMSMMTTTVICDLESPCSRRVRSAAAAAAAVARGSAMASTASFAFGAAVGAVLGAFPGNTVQLSFVLLQVLSVIVWFCCMFELGIPQRL